MEFKVGKNTIFYEIKGEGQPIVILHAMGTDHRSMMGWLEPIFTDLRGFARIYVDIPAHGRSVCKSAQSTEDMLGILLQFIDRVLEEQTFALIGHSYGGYLAQGILRAKEDDVTGICLLAPALHRKERTLPEKVVKDKDEVSLTSVDPDIRLAFETLMVYQNRENLATFLKEVQPGRLVADRDFLGSNWRENGYFYTHDPLAQPVLQPSLLIAGKQDSICGYKDYTSLLETFPNLSLAVLNQAGHLMTIEKRKIVQALVRDWLEIINEGYYHEKNVHLTREIQ